MEGRPRSQPDDLINFRQLRSNALQAAELDIYDGDDMRFVLNLYYSCVASHVYYTRYITLESLEILYIYIYTVGQLRRFRAALLGPSLAPLKRRRLLQ